MRIDKEKCSMNKQEILKNVLNYINNEKAEYAVLIDGPWGSGKTYLYKNFLAEKIADVEAGKDHKKANVYISLYGISTVEELSKELFTNYMLKVKCNGSELKGKIYKASSGIASIVSKAITISVGALSFDFSGIESLNEIMDIKDMVICFDDLERCTIPVNSLFGFINNLVEHCNCKVLILADENNIGKMYANTNIEAKYSTLLSGKKLVKGIDERGKEKEINTDENLTIGQLKRLNEELYSENYVYKDIKEKVIGMSLVYVLDLNDDIDNIIKETLRSNELKSKLIEKKDDILKCMTKCGNRNIRIIHTWLLGFEQIFGIINRNFKNSDYYEDIFEKFMVYSIYTACAVGKNRKLTKWEKDMEWGTVKFTDLLLWQEGYRFIDDLYACSVIEEESVCRAARYIEREKQKEAEEMRRTQSRGSALQSLNHWMYMEDVQVEELLGQLRQELREGMYVISHYQNVLGNFIFFKHIGFCVDDLEEIQRIMMNHIDATEDIIGRIRLQQFFNTEDERKEFYQYYDPIQELIVKKSQEKEKQSVNESLKYKNAAYFEEFCEEKSSLFLSRKTFMGHVDSERLLECIKQSDLEGIYHIIGGIKRVYDFQNLYEFYMEDVSALKKLKEDIQNPDLIEWKGKTREYAKKYFVDVLDDIIRRIEQK